MRLEDAFRNTALRIIAVSWIFILLLLAYLYFTRDFRQYRDVIGSGATSSRPLALTSAAFGNGEPIPVAYTCDGAGEPPPLSIANPPHGTKSYAILVEDGDVPRALKPDGTFLHSITYDIPAGETTTSAAAGTPGMNDAGTTAYIAPCPPPQYEPREHRYIFTIIALDATLSLPAGTAQEQLLAAMIGHELGRASLTGRYARRGK